MEKIYDDEMMPNNFETIAKAYSQSLKDKGFVFIKLEEEEFHLLLDEIFVIYYKMYACLEKIDIYVDSKVLKNNINESLEILSKTFHIKKTHKIKCVENEKFAFLSLISLENLLILKLMILSAKSGEIEVCHNLIVNISKVFADSFSTEGFSIN